MVCTYQVGRDLDAEVRGTGCGPHTGGWSHKGLYEGYLRFGGHDVALLRIKKHPPPLISPPFKVFEVSLQSEVILKGADLSV